MEEGNKEGFYPKETSQGLPIVSKKTVKAIESQFTTGGEHKWGEHLEKVKTRLIEENPHLVKFIEKQVDKYPQALHTPMFEVIVGAIALLEHQTNANIADKLFDVDNKPQHK